MACLYTLKGFHLDMCATNLAGIKEIYLTDDLDAVSATLAADSAATISAITVEGDVKFLGYQLEKWQGYLTSTPNYNDSGRLLNYTNEIRVAFSKLTERNHLEFLALTHNPVYAIVLDNNGQYHFLGYDTYLSATSGYAQTGQASGDENGYEVILQSQSAYPSLFVSKEIAEAVIEEPAS